MIYRSIYRLKFISVKYRRYITIFAIFDDYRLHYFCTILYIQSKEIGNKMYLYYKETGELVKWQSEISFKYRCW